MQVKGKLSILFALVSDLNIANGSKQSVTGTSSRKSASSAHVHVCIVLLALAFRFVSCVNHALPICYNYNTLCVPFLISLFFYLINFVIFPLH